MKSKLSLFILILSSLFIGCKEIKVEDGRLPKEYFKAAAPYVGVYSGRFAGNKLNFELTLNQDSGYVLAKFDQDPLHNSCQSKVGNLVKFVGAGSEKEPRLEEAVFSFDPNLCWADVEGKNLYISFSKSRSGEVTAKMQIFERTHRERVCTIGPNGQQCHWESTNYYFTGKFKK